MTSVSRDASERVIRRQFVAVLAVFLALVTILSVLVIWTITSIRFRG